MWKLQSLYYILLNQMPKKLAVGRNLNINFIYNQ